MVIKAVFIIFGDFYMSDTVVFTLIIGCLFIGLGVLSNGKNSKRPFRSSLMRAVLLTSGILIVVSDLAIIFFLN